MYSKGYQRTHGITRTPDHRTKIILPSRLKFESPNGTSDNSEVADGPNVKPSLFRKKSGEPVKSALRPISRRRCSSMPGTPTHAKTVHFNDSVNQMRHFMQVDMPIAVSAGSSPVETYESEGEFPFEGGGEVEREIKLSNFPPDTLDRRTWPVRVERIFLSPDRETLIGVCAVQNLAFHKAVVARFTLDYWKTASEVVAEYNNNPKNPPLYGCDRFDFHIKLSDQANIDDKTLLLCVRYNVSGQEFWDNNENTNYQIDFTRVTKKPSKPSLPNGLDVWLPNALPSSRLWPPTSSWEKRGSIDDDFASRFNSNSAYFTALADQLLGESPDSIKLERRSKRGRIYLTSLETAPNSGLSGRYDFGASLSAALSSAQADLGCKKGARGNAQKRTLSNGSASVMLDHTGGPSKAEERPDAINTDRRAMSSDEYKDLVQRFCYVGSANRNPLATKASKSMISNGLGACRLRTTPPGRHSPPAIVSDVCLIQS